MDVLCQVEEVAAITNGGPFDSVLASGSVEYIDVNEENDVMVSVFLVGISVLYPTLLCGIH